MKQCSKCKELKDESEFHKNKKSKDGLKSVCKECRKIESCMYYINNSDSIKEKSKKWENNNPERVRTNKRIWAKNNPDKVRKAQNKYKKNNPEKCKSRNKKHNDTEKAKESRIKWSINNSEKKKIINKNWSTSYSKYSTYFEKLSPYEECRRDPDNEDLLQVRCKNCNDWLNPTNRYIQTRLDAVLLNRRKNGYLFCSLECKDKFYNHIIDSEYEEFRKYRNLSESAMNRQYKNNKHIINPLDLPRKRGMYSIDHIYSVSDGFRNRVPIDVLNNPFNLRMLSESENCSKNGSSYITLGELYEDYYLYLEMCK